MKSYIRDIRIRGGPNCCTSEDSFDNPPLTLGKTKYHNATTRSPSLERTCLRVDAGVGEAINRNYGVFDEALCVGREKLEHKSIVSKRHLVEESVKQKDGPTPSILSADGREASEAIQKDRGGLKVREASFSLTAQPQPMKIDERIEPDQTPYEPDGASNEETSPTMDWSDENISCGEALGHRPNCSLKHNHEHAKAKDIREVDDWDMERDDEGNSKDAAGVEKTSNPQAQKLRTHTLLNFVKVLPEELNGSAYISHQEQSKHQDTGAGNPGWTEQHREVSEADKWTGNDRPSASTGDLKRSSGGRLDSNCRERVNVGVSEPANYYP